MIFVCALFIVFALAVWDVMFDDGVVHTIGHTLWPMQWNQWFQIEGRFEHDGWYLANDNAHELQTDDRQRHLFELQDYEEVI